MNTEVKEFIVKLRKFINENEEEMTYYLTDFSFKVIQTGKLYDFLLAKEGGYEYEDV